MSPALVFIVLAVCTIALAGIPNVEPEYLDMLRAAGEDEEFARLMGIHVSLVRPQGERSEKESEFTTVSDLGDILLNQEQEEQARQGWNFANDERRKWPNNEIPYVISRSDFTTTERNVIISAINSLNSKTTKIKIRPRRGQADYVMVIQGAGCFSALGRNGSQQVLSIDKDRCLTEGLIQHEFMHAIGFVHEHSRPDRDEHVEVLWHNIDKKYHGHYQKFSTDQVNNILSYDYYSLTHYGMNAPFSDKRAFKILGSNVDEYEIGQRDGLTDMDIRKINMLYP